MAFSDTFIGRHERAIGLGSIAAGAAVGGAIDELVLEDKLGFEFFDAIPASVAFAAIFSLLFYRAFISVSIMTDDFGMNADGTPK